MGGKEPHPTINIVSYTTRRYDPLLFIKSSYPTDRETVARMDIGHSQRARDDPGQMGYISHLLQAILLPDFIQHLFCYIYQTIGPHLSFSGDKPAIVIQFL